MSEKIRSEKTQNEKIIAFFENDRFAMTSGVRLLEASPGAAVARLAITPDSLNAAGGVQGGAIFTLCDFAFAAAVNASGELTVSVSANIQYFRQAKGRFLTARAREVSRSRRLCACVVDVFDEDESLIASFTGTGYIKGDGIRFE